MIPSSKCMEVKCPRCGWITPVRLDAADIQIYHDKKIFEYVDELKQLVRDLWEGFECDRCPLYGDDCWWKQGDELKTCRMMNWMRGLGIEVGE